MKTYNQFLETPFSEEIKPPEPQEEDPGIKSKQKRQMQIKKQVLLKKMQAVRAGAGADIVASYEPEGEVVEGLKQARKNVGADKCWDGYKAKGTKKKGGKTVPNCVKEEEVVAEHHQKDKDGNTIPHEGEELEEGKRGLYDNIHAKRKRGESPAKPGDKGYPAKDAFKKAAKTAKEEVELTEKKLDPVGKEDKDIDNDGDHDKSDKYLIARRKKVSKILAMKKKK